MRFFLILLLFFSLADNASAWQTPNITDIRLGAHTDYSRVVIDLNGKLSYRVSRDDGGNIIVDFPTGIVSANVMSSKSSVINVKDSVVDEIKVEKLGKGSRVKILLGKGAGPYKASLFEKPYRLVIDVKKIDIIRTGFQKKENKIEVVILDAGHGGKDPGAIGRRGLREKTVVLDIARRTQKLLQRTNKVKVILTRQKDEFISLDERVKIANKYKGALFVSVHTNSHLNKKASGFETFYLGETKTDDARAAAILENSVLELEERPFLSDIDRVLGKILWDLRLNEFKIESKELAEVVHTNMDKNLALTNRGIKGAPFYILRGVAMPAVLLETAFISNLKEEALLKRSGFRQTIAQALYTSIFQYKGRFEHSQGFTN